MFILSTPTHEFKLPRDPSTYEKIKITYVQNGKIVLEKSKNDLAIDGNIVSFQMTQEESRKFVPGQVAQVQVRAKDAEGRAFVSDKRQFKVEDTFNREVL